ncbi:hypothetical protein ACGK9R_16755 [Halomonas sp. HNIBRBA4712]|uniref:hypothetical protein n=1 Tax=Halomonas sp. HNIBRBA4712 TaxID=3373087 RepID=UPI003745CB0A
MELVATDISQFRCPLIHCNDTRAFFDSFSFNNAAYTIAVSNECKLDIEVIINDPRVIVFVFSGAKSNDKVITTPYFMARGLGAGLDASIVYVSDPSYYLHKDLKLAWYAGSSSYRAQTELPKILSFISNKINAERKIFFGGSGGGFASLFYSRLLSNSMAIVWNPQINISNYPAPAGRYSVVDFYSKLAFNTSREALKNYIVDDLSLEYGTAKHDNMVIYMQNITDHHAERDLAPFLESYNCRLPTKNYSGFIDDNFYLHYTNWSKGHRPPPKAALAYLIERFSRPSLQWSKNVFPKTFMKAERFAAFE